MWDLPTRLFHWALVALIVLSFVSGQLEVMELHEWSGIVILGLLVFRVLWGFFGGTHARFGSFVRGPRAVIAYARNVMKPGAARFAGHNPLGGWSVVLMLACLAVQAGSGLFANDDTNFEGPLAGRVSKATSDFFTHVHHINLNVLYVLVALHVGAVVFYLVKKGENLVRPMVTGYKEWGEAGASGGTGDIEHRGGSTLVAVILAAIAAAAVYAVIR